ncbi:MAG: B12-binding domain-containing radical SAM protein [Candidatus Hadarchaeum sp.]|uniref:B12-binding domain-containing radical SAM protein n=1 Tax=Candidatus Hadarchaeum sp. TaxID=2883567 RepID=UPI003D137DFF
MKVVLINANMGQKERIENEAAWPPLGLLYLGSVLQLEGHEVKVIDNARERLPLEKLSARVKWENSDIVGISALTPTFKQALKIATLVKEESPETKIVFGNYHATFEFRRLLEKYPIVDFVVLGEGEIVLPELINALENGTEIKQVKGIAFRRRGKVVKNPPQELVQDLDKLPFPDRSLLEQEYHSELVGLLGASGKFTTILSSRGCPFACRYCACSAFSRRKVRFRSPENVVAEMELLCSQGYEEVGFVDDNLLLNRKRVEKICELLRARKVKLDLWAEGRVDQASAETLRELSRAGCRTIYFGIESAAQKVLDYYGKNITPGMSRRAVTNAKKADIENVIGSFIVGAPIETKADIRETFDFALSLRQMDFPQMNILSLSPGTELWNHAVEKGYLDEEKYWDVALPAVEVLPSVLNEGELNEMINGFYQEFVRRPSYLISQILKTLKSGHRMKILLANLRSETGLRSIGQLWSG